MFLFYNDLPRAFQIKILITGETKYNSDKHEYEVLSVPEHLAYKTEEEEE